MSQALKEQYKQELIQLTLFIEELQRRNLPVEIQNLEDEEASTLVLEFDTKSRRPKVTPNSSPREWLAFLRPGLEMSVRIAEHVSKPVQQITQGATMSVTRSNLDCLAKLIAEHAFESHGISVRGGMIPTDHAQAFDAQALEIMQDTADNLSIPDAVDASISVSQADTFIASLVEEHLWWKNKGPFTLCKNRPIASAPLPPLPISNQARRRGSWNAANNGRTRIQIAIKWTTFLIMFAVLAIILIPQDPNNVGNIVVILAAIAIVANLVLLVMGLTLWRKVPRGKAVIGSTIATLIAAIILAVISQLLPLWPIAYGLIIIGLVGVLSYFEGVTLKSVFTSSTQP